MQKSIYNVARTISMRFIIRMNHTKSNNYPAAIVLLAVASIITCFCLFQTLGEFSYCITFNGVSRNSKVAPMSDMQTNEATRVSVANHITNADLESTEENTHQMKSECDTLAAIWTVENIADIPDSDCKRLEVSCGVSDCHEAVFDAVITWVNGSDPVWKTNFGNAHRYALAMDSTLAKSSVANSRFRDFDQFKYALRSVEENAPWVRRIYIITDSQWPIYLRPANQARRLRHVTHTELFDNYYKAMRPELLDSNRMPCYNSVALELLTPFIDTLSDVYVNMNDDMGFLNPTPLDFMYNTTSEKAVLRLWSLYNTTFAQNRDKVGMDWVKMIKEPVDVTCPKADAPNICRIPTHGPIMVHKQNILSAWNKIPEVMEKTVYHPFRSQNDPTVWPFVMLLGWPSHYESRAEENENMFAKLTRSTYKDVLIQMKEDRKTKMMCLNDDIEDDAVTPEIMQQIHEAYETRFPGKAAFEI